MTDINVASSQWSIIFFDKKKLPVEQLKIKLWKIKNQLKSFTNQLLDQMDQIDLLEVVKLVMNYLKEVCVPNKTEDLNINVFNMIRGKNE